MEEALKDAAVQLIVVGTPNETHFELAKQALLAGKHVVIDKPFAATSAEAKELKELAEKQGLVLAPFHNRRWDGDFLTVRKLLEEDAVGRLVTYESHFDRFRPLPREEYVEGRGECGEWVVDGSGTASCGSGFGVVWCAEGDYCECSQGSGYNGY